jgi:hypothetical protein
VNETREIGGNFGESGSEGSSGEAPQRVVSGVMLGGEAFQQRGLIEGSVPSGYVDGIVGMASWGAKIGDPATAIAELGRLSFAQAEYYFDHDGRTPREEWMWSRRWTARLRRFRAPAKTSAGPASALFGQAMARLADSFSH